jgi:iron-sulfur cluster assembly accessory protein
MNSIRKLATLSTNMKAPISVTNSAWTKLKDIIDKNSSISGLLFSVTSGGCNGFNYNIEPILSTELPEIVNKKPTVITHHNTNIYIDPLSEMYLIGTEIDYKEADYSNNIYDSKFVFNVDNTYASQCGCGVSFMPKKKG